MFKLFQPFSSGAMRFAYKGAGYTPNEGTQNVVMKKFKDKKVYNESDWKGDIKCYKLAITFINEWNKLRLVSKKYIMYEPVIIAAGHNVLCHKSRNDDEKESEKESINEGEYIMIEKYLNGDYTKWNSNNGWFGNSSISVQAFCHWTYDHSGGNLLMCDAQGVRGKDAYYITDPAILSVVPGQYGCTDIGPQGITNWFAYHKCNQHCKKSWKKPANQQYNPYIVSKESSYRWKTGI
jgi:hypothetical protein